MDVGAGRLLAHRHQLAFAQDLEVAQHAGEWLEERARTAGLESSLRPAGAELEQTLGEDGTALFVALGGVLEVSRETFGAYSSVQFEGLLGTEREQGEGEGAEHVRISPAIA